MINRKPLIWIAVIVHILLLGASGSTIVARSSRTTDTHGTFRGFLYSNGTYTTTLDDPSTGHASAGGVFPADVDVRAQGRGGRGNVSFRVLAPSGRPKTSACLSAFGAKRTWTANPR